MSDHDKISNEIISKLHELSSKQFLQLQNNSSADHVDRELMGTLAKLSVHQQPNYLAPETTQALTKALEQLINISQNLPFAADLSNIREITVSKDDDNTNSQGPGMR